MYWGGMYNPLIRRWGASLLRAPERQVSYIFYEYYFMKIDICFVIRHINHIGHLMPNQVKENKSETKFKGEVLGIND